MKAASALFIFLLQTSVLLVSGGMSAAIFANTLLNEPTEPSSPSLSLDDQIQLIDAEILILKAELSRKSGEVQQVKQYLVELKRYEASGLTEPMQQRIGLLLRYVEDAQLLPPSADSTEVEAFQFNPQKIVILLPLSGPYQPIGEQILAGLKTQFEQYQPVVIDSHIFDSMLELWELVKLYNPTLIIGPLQKHKAQALNDLKVGVPTLYLNDVIGLENNQKSFSMNRLNHVQFLVDLILQNRHERVTFLTDASPSADRFLKQLQAVWPVRKQRFFEETGVALDEHFEFQTVIGSVDQTMMKQLNAQRSLGRKNWLQKKIQTSLTFDERARKDLELIVSILPFRRAMQVTPLLEFYRLHSVAHYWLPSQLPKRDELQKSLSFWHDTQVIFPIPFAQSVMSDTTEILPSSINPSQTGTFYAFGVLAAKVVMQLTADDLTPIESEIGVVQFESNAFPWLLPRLYWLNEGKMTAPFK